MRSFRPMKRVLPSALVGSLLAAWTSIASFAAAQPQRHVDAQRLWQTLERLSEFGRPEGAGFAGGVTRLAFSTEDLAAREYVMQLMRKARLAVRTDAAGNIFGRRDG